MRKLFLIVIFLALTSFANADIITLKSGKVIEATIVQRTDDFVKVEVDGIELVLYTDEIESINDSNQKEDVAVKAEVPSDVAKVNKPMIEEGTDNAEDVLEPASNEVMDDSAVEVEDAENMEEADIPQRNEEQIADDETEDIESAEELQDQGDMEELEDQEEAQEPTALETDVVIYDGDSTAEVKSEEETDDTGSEEAAEDLNME